VVSRLVFQKGLDLTIGVTGHIVRQGGQIAIIGRGEPQEEEAARELAQPLPGPGRCAYRLNETDARRMFAGSDFLLMPSRYEPCGLSQMYAQRFGSLPVARNTGGLADTIEDGVSGFLFEEPTVESYAAALTRAIKVFANPELLNAMRCRAMRKPVRLAPSHKALQRPVSAIAEGQSGIPGGPLTQWRDIVTHSQPHIRWFKTWVSTTSHRSVARTPRWGRCTRT